MVERSFSSGRLVRWSLIGLALGVAAIGLARRSSSDDARSPADIGDTGARAAAGPDASDSPPPFTGTKEELRARVEEYARLRVAGDWESLYEMTPPEERSVVDRGTFLDAYGHGVVRVHALETRDLAMAPERRAAKVRMLLDAELLPDRLPERYRRGLQRPGAEDLRQTDEIELEWTWQDGAWWFCMDRELVEGLDRTGRSVVPLHECGGRRAWNQKTEGNRDDRSQKGGISKPLADRGADRSPTVVPPLGEIERGPVMFAGPAGGMFQLRSAPQGPIHDGEIPMKFVHKFGITALAVLAGAPLAHADGRNPGSALVYPVHRSGQGWFTVVSVTNSNVTPVTGSTLAHFEYVNVVPNPTDPQLPLGCTVFNRVELLTPADTLSVLTTCHNATAGQQEGYLVVSAQDPNQFGVAFSHNFLMGSELVVNSSGGMYSLNAIPFEAIPAAGMPTDLNGNQELDFDGAEYEGVPDTLYIDSFLALAGSHLALINLTGGPDAQAVVQFDVWNDNEFPLSTTKVFKCWFDQPLTNVSPLFDQFFLSNNTPNDPSELDLTCNNLNDVETGWARINGVVANSPFNPPIANPALLGAITAGPSGPIDGGHLLWESTAKQHNGTFLDA